MREDQRRKLHMTASDPSEKKGKIDRRVFHIDLKRPDINLPEGEVEKLRWAQASEDRDEKLRRLQETLKEFIATGTKLGHLLQRDNQRVLRVVLHRLAGIANESAENEDIPQWEGSEMNTLENLLQQWTSDELTCRNGIVVEYSMALTGCLMANTAVHAVGAGQASKNAGVYLVKYLSKDSVQIAISADAIVDAHTRAEQHHSTAEDSGSATRKTQQCR